MKEKVKKSTEFFDTNMFLNNICNRSPKMKEKSEIKSTEFFALRVLGVCEAIELPQTMEG